MVILVCAFSKSDFHMVSTGTFNLQQHPVPMMMPVLPDDMEKPGKLPMCQGNAAAAKLPG